jgi:RNA polymerase sigma factor (TIGR02999 family)
MTHEAPDPNERDPSSPAPPTHEISALWPSMYEDLRSIAGERLASESPGHTLQPTALVNEAFLRLVASSDLTIRGREHLIALAGTAMRRVLIDHARGKRARKRQSTSDVIWIELEPAWIVDILVIDDLLSRLSLLDASAARLVELRFFAGLTMDEIADLLRFSPRTADARWRFARTWLRGHLAA